ncbi:mannose-1-phosphate guanylyltransferase/mannose-6-phosphate isomerase [Raoultella planticola]|uniref:mannose-1-phosphate guanylyltransferase/mannose-6-phosphate isomerase n=1 Tax=Raoultella planticola TaxID=575 RepID=UPI001C9D6CB1|nr:mannose-1-phosphate guanylyltransferase/mannose-6-phosphate isomerase [Raoultella planticola]MDM9674190.1 mannose-1-phosphate guanylyltransferase/mannose-6-phosphate isomerase [Raoultella planticola]QZS65882.1 mannose-1-phosphate guanylyltransferase/mannose-6-phosphate isomerase [Raoultella planticola]HDG9809451.1 mannose-1-phosphate guanylyltransferase/mannose-6-phosphate isomerase [Raoultella planticola]HDH7821998.1 mannose-1-phosphate guanylyltransferase/mannose-6-phosphate isomerase [Rao
MLLPVIMAGGTGSRLWPMSRELYPKQFLRLYGQNSMLQETITRLSGLDTHEPMVICNEEHRFLVAEQLRQLDKLSHNIILEPVGRNTAPAIALAALQATKNGDDPLLLVLAADHIINNVQVFHEAVRVAQKYAEIGHLVTFGIVPDSPETGYGYIQRGDVLDDTQQAPYKVARFVEKPDRTHAEAYLSSGEYYWNSGMFMFRAKKYLSELAKYRPDILEACKKSVSSAEDGNDFISIPHDIFCACPDESVDYAVMEKTADAVVVGLDADWNDVGSWSALWDVSPKDHHGNVLTGDSWVHNSQNCYINSDGQLVAAIGVENLVIISTKDAVLVMDKERAQDVKKIVEHLKQNKRSEYKRHREIYRPWGRSDVIVQTSRFNVNRITVKPGGAFSMQMHHHRAEHWVILSGTGQITVNGKQFLLTENQSTFIPIGAEHCLENPGKIPLEVLEIQSGTYLGEDDIIRIKDQYGRC